MEDFHMGVYQPMFLKITKKVSDMAEETGRGKVIPKVNIYFRSTAARKKPMKC